MLVERPSTSDEELARQTQAGSLTAFEELVYRYERRLYAFVSQCSRSADAREVTQETLVKAFQAIAQYEPRRSFAAWLFTIARRKCIDHYRSTRPMAEGTAVPEGKDLRDPAVLLAEREEHEALWVLARERLPELQFQAIWLRYAGGMDVKEIAQVLGKTQTHVKVLLFRARKALAQELTLGHHARSPANSSHALGAPSPKKASCPPARAGCLGFSLAERKGFL